MTHRELLELWLRQSEVEAAAGADAVLGYWVDLHAQVIGYRWGLRFCAYLSAVGLIVSLFIHRRKEVNIFDSG